MTSCSFLSQMSPTLAVPTTAPVLPGRVGPGELGQAGQIVDLALGIDRRHADPANAEAGDLERIGATLIGEYAMTAAGIADVGHLDLVHLDEAAGLLAHQGRRRPDRLVGAAAGAGRQGDQQESGWQRAAGAACPTSAGLFRHHGTIARVMRVGRPSVPVGTPV